MKLIGIGIVCLLLFGCAQVSQFTLDASKQNLENAKITRQIIEETWTTWSLNSGIIQCGTEEIIPASMLKDVQKLDRIVKNAKMWSEEDYQKGCFMGISLKLTIKEMQALIERVIGIIAQFK